MYGQQEQLHKAADREPEAKSKGNYQPRKIYFEPNDDADSDSEEPRRGRVNPQETLIEREIRLQKEREEALARERQLAMAMLAANKQTCGSIPVPSKASGAEVKAPEIGRKPALVPSGDGAAVNNTEIRISEEIRELKRREQELRRLREMNAKNDVRDGRDSHDADSDQMPSMSTSGDEGLYSDADANSDERDVISEANSRSISKLFNTI